MNFYSVSYQLYQEGSPVAFGTIGFEFKSVNSKEEYAEFATAYNKIIVSENKHLSLKVGDIQILSTAKLN